MLQTLKLTDHIKSWWTLHKLYCLDLSGKSIFTKVEPKSWVKKLVVVNNSFSNNNWRWLQTTYSQLYTWSDAVLCAPGHSRLEVWKFKCWSISTAKNLSDLLVWLLGENLCGLWCLAYQCVEADWYLRSSHSNTIGLFKPTCVPIVWFSTGDWFDLAPSGEFPTLNPWTWLSGEHFLR